MAIVKLSWSGGKDSTASALLHLERGDKLKMVCYVPMFTNDIPLILKSHYEFILKSADYFRSRGADVYIVHGITYYDFVLRRKTKGVNKGSIMGFPSFIVRKCYFKSYSKIPALNAIDVGFYDYEDIGIAYDEFSRTSQLTEFKRSILYELKYTENMALNLCSINQLLSPIYNFSTRDGCVLCPHCSSSRRILWFKDYPDAFNILLDLQSLVLVEKPDIYPLRNSKLFIERNLQLGILYNDEFIIN